MFATIDLVLVQCESAAGVIVVSWSCPTSGDKGEQELRSSSHPDARIQHMAHQVSANSYACIFSSLPCQQATRNNSSACFSASFAQCQINSLNEASSEASSESEPEAELSEAESEADVQESVR
jgi:hypothetical protein